MATFTLLCALVGVQGNLCGVSIERTKTVSDLKNAIAAAKKDVIKCDADRLQLFLAKKDDAWLLDADEVATKLKAGIVNGDIQAMINAQEAMNDSWGIQEWLDAKRMPPLQTKQIHILVVVPGLGGRAIKIQRPLERIER